MSQFNHVKNANVRAYLRSDKSTTLDKACTMIDIAVNAFEDDERNQKKYTNLDDRALSMFDAINEAQYALGQGDSVGVRIALRDFWLA
jgi:hypothetical protein